MDAVGGLTINNSALNQANAVQELKDHKQDLTTQLKEEINQKITTNIKAFSLTQHKHLPPSFDYSSLIPADPYASTLNHQMYATTQQNNQALIQKLLQPVQQMHQRMDQCRVHLLI